VTLAQAREVYPIVVALEALALRQALPHATPAALRRMRAANARLVTALAACDTCAAQEADRELHSEVIGLSGNAELQAMLAALISKVQRIERAFWGDADRSASVVDHAELIARIAAGDAEGAQAALARNWERGLAWVAAPDASGAVAAATSADLTAAAHARDGRRARKARGGA
jgi:DNA-binding GntR family transcriptional regulator